MTVALRAVHDALDAGDSTADRWRSLISRLSRDGGHGRTVEARDVEAALRALDVRGTVCDWTTNLRHLGVLSEAGCLDPDRAVKVAVALEIAADSFTSLGAVSSWSPVATLPVEMRAMLRPGPLSQTAGVLLELVDSASEEIRLATPFVDRMAAAFLSNALIVAGRRGVSVRVITSAGHGARFLDVAHCWPDERSGSLTVFEANAGASPLGSHAKVLVADGCRGYVGSANLTAAGLGRQIEIGVEVAGPQCAALANLLEATERVATRVAAACRPGR